MFFVLRRLLDIAFVSKYHGSFFCFLSSSNPPPPPPIPQYRHWQPCSLMTVNLALLWSTVVGRCSAHCRATPGRCYTSSLWTYPRSTVLTHDVNTITFDILHFTTGILRGIIKCLSVQGTGSSFILCLSGRGGQSALRFARLRMEKRHNYVRKVAETAVQLFVSNDKVNVAGMVLAGSADFKTELSQSDMFDPVSLRVFW